MGGVRVGGEGGEEVWAVGEMLSGIRGIGERGDGGGRRT